VTVRLKVTDRDGESREVHVEQGVSLMMALREGGFGVEGTCGGACSCGSCHVYAGDDLLSHLQDAEEDERDMLEALADVVEVRPHSRLSCQITVSDEMDGASVEVAPQF
jgi:2Fe-2S ferredoxin